MRVFGGDETCEGSLELPLNQLQVVDKVDCGELVIVFDCKSSITKRIRYHVYDIVLNE
jgi:hypothetical protein